MQRWGTLGDYLAGATAEGVATWRGELRSAARANLLPGVVSARIDLKAACARAERSLERYAEPLQALYGDAWSEPFLALAWQRMFQNAAHDSICGCSTDEVSAEVLVRYGEAEQIGCELARRAVARIAEEVPRGAFAVVNPTPRARRGLVELEVDVPDEWEAVELELGGKAWRRRGRAAEPFEWETKVAGAEVPVAIARRLHGRELFGRVLNGFHVEGRAWCSSSATNLIRCCSTWTSSSRRSLPPPCKATGRCEPSNVPSERSSQPWKRRHSAGRPSDQARSKGQSL